MHLYMVQKTFLNLSIHRQSFGKNILPLITYNKVSDLYIPYSQTLSDKLCKMKN